MKKTSNILIQNLNKRSYIFLILFLFFINVQNINTKNILDNIDQKITFDEMLILESKRAAGKYIEVNTSSYKFKKYDMKHLPDKLNMDKKMYTMRNTFYIDQKLINEDISIFVGPADYPFDLYINGSLILKRGRYKDSHNASTYHSNNLLLLSNYLNYGNVSNNIAMQAFPKHEINYPPDIAISSSKIVTSMAFWRNFFNVHLVQGVALISLLLFIYFLFLFFTRRTKDLRYLYFAVLCFFYFLAYSNISFKNDFSNEILLEKISRFSFPMTVLFLAFFVMEFTGILNKKIWLKIAMGIPPLTLSIITLFLNSKESIRKLFTISSNFFITPAIIFGITLLIISVIKYKRKSSIFILIGFAVVVATSLRDIRYLTNSITPYSWSVPFGYIALAIGLFFILALEQSRIFEDSILRTKELDKKNCSLKKMVDNITLVSESLVESSKMLDENVSKTVAVVEDYGQSNKMIMENVLLEFNELDKVITKIAENIDISNKKIPLAILSQTSVVEEVTSTITNMNSDLEKTMKSALESNEAANKLSNMADKSSKNIIESKNSIHKVSEYSIFINQILNTIEDITEKTNVLSINASIESANSGEKGKGFAIIAGEIRALAKKSKTNLASSFEKITEMKDVILQSTQLSDGVSENLMTIIKESKSSAGKIENITNLVKEQKNQSDAILQAIQSLLEDTLTIKDLIKQQENDNENMKNTLLELKASFESVTELLKTQETKQNDLNDSLVHIKRVLDDNLKNIDILNESLNFSDEEV